VPPVNGKVVSSAEATVALTALPQQKLKIFTDKTIVFDVSEVRIERFLR
jgi:hypothetical protein